ncbi:MAG TPA: MBL fold metallo-hydrolase [Bacillota bacterium]|nr:MBL fold metallo-hydrolase [Bacillota bacterium]
MIKRLISGNPLIYGLCSSVWLIQNRYNIIIDSGSRICRDQLSEALRKNGVTPEMIDGVVYTHLHMDHCWNHVLFPDVPVFVSGLERQRMEGFLAKISNHPGHFADEMRQYLGFPDDLPSFLLNNMTKFFFHDQIPQLILSGRVLQEADLRAMGLAPVPTPGHTAGHIAFVYEKEDNRYCFSGDALMNHESYRNPEQNMIFNEDWAQYFASKKILEAKVGWFCPGHGQEFSSGGSEAIGTENQN